MVIESTFPQSSAVKPSEEIGEREGQRLDNADQETVEQMAKVLKIALAEGEAQEIANRANAQALKIVEPALDILFAVLREMFNKQREEKRNSS